MAFGTTCACRDENDCGGADIVWRAYREYRGFGAFDLSRHFGIGVGRISKYHPFEARMSRAEPKANGAATSDMVGPSGWAILLPADCPSQFAARDRFLAFHELGHFMLHRVHEDWMLGRFKTCPGGLAMAEDWCDGFAVAMLFAWYGKDVVPAEDPHPFFQGDGLGPPDCDIAVGERMLRLCRALPPSEQRGIGPIARLAAWMIREPYDPAR